MNVHHAGIEQLPPSEIAPVVLEATFVTDLRTMLPRWEAMLAEIKRLFAERYPDAAGPAATTLQIGGS